MAIDLAEQSSSPTSDLLSTSPTDNSESDYKHCLSLKDTLDVVHLYVLGIIQVGHMAEQECEVLLIDFWSDIWLFISDQKSKTPKIYNLLSRETNKKWLFDNFSSPRLSFPYFLPLTAHLNVPRAVGGRRLGGGVGG